MWFYIVFLLTILPALCRELSYKSPLPQMQLTRFGHKKPPGFFLSKNLTV